MARQKCPHNRQKSRCKDCGGGSICEHNRRRSRCKECGGGSICEHNRRRSRCKDCGGGEICEHDRRRSRCKDCGGGSICEHNRRKDTCKDCGGSSICEHMVNKHGCAICSPYKCEQCGVYVVNRRNSQGERLCSFCDLNSKRVSVYDQNRPEMKLNQFISSKVETTYPIGTYAPFRSCGDNNKPDTVCIMTNMMFIIETDENNHAGYQISCEWAKALQHGQSALQTDNIKRVCFIRFNPSSWKVNDETVRYPLKKRFEDLYDFMVKCYDEQMDVYTLYHMFYPVTSEEDKVKRVSVTELQEWFDELSQ